MKKIKGDVVGFVVPESQAEVAPAGHFGLLGIQEPMASIGAKLRIGPSPGHGTCLHVSFPVK